MLRFHRYRCYRQKKDVYLQFRFTVNFFNNFFSSCSEKGRCDREKERGKEFNMPKRGAGRGGKSAPVIEEDDSAPFVEDTQPESEEFVVQGKGKKNVSIREEDDVHAEGGEPAKQRYAHLMVPIRNIAGELIIKK